MNFIPERLAWFVSRLHGFSHYLEWKCCKSIDGSKTWVSWSAQPIHLLTSCTGMNPYLLYMTLVERCRQISFWNENLDPMRLPEWSRSGMTRSGIQFWLLSCKQIQILSMEPGWSRTGMKLDLVSCKHRLNRDYYWKSCFLVMHIDTVAMVTISKVAFYIFKIILFRCLCAM